MNQTQMQAAQAAMSAWLAHPLELGKAPKRIECAGQFDYQEMRYYIFKYKSSLFGPWLVGVCGGYEGDDLTHCGYVFSEMQPYNEATAKKQCIAMVEMMMNYWRARAEQYLKENPRQ